MFEDSVKTLDNYTPSKYSLPNVLSLDIVLDNARENISKLKELYNNYKTIISILNASLEKIPVNKLERTDYMDLLVNSCKKNQTIIIECSQQKVATPPVSSSSPVGKSDNNISLVTEQPVVAPAHEVKPSASAPAAETQASVPVPAPVQVQPIPAVVAPAVVSSANETQDSASAPAPVQVQPIPTVVEPALTVPDPIPDIDQVISENAKVLKLFKTNCKKLEADKAVVESCIQEMNSFKSKGLNVANALAPLRAQSDEIQNRLDTYIRAVVNHVNRLNNEINTFKSDIEN